MPLPDKNRKSAALFALLSLFIPPAGAAVIVIAPGDDIQAAVNANPAGTSFSIQPGIHRLTSPIAPKSGNSFVGQPGAVLSGSKLITNWTQSGAYWFSTGQTQGPTIVPMPGLPEDQHCYAEALYGDEVFYNDSRLTRVLSQSALTPGASDPAWMSPNRFYFDYSADTIWINVNPSGAKMEGSVSGAVIVGAVGTDDVTVEGLIIEKSVYFGLAANGSRWTVKNNEFRLHHNWGLVVHSGARATGNKIHHNGMIGVTAFGSDVLLEGNEVGPANNEARYYLMAPPCEQSNWGSGGSKFVQTSGMIVRGNNFHGNYGDGIWFDVDNFGALIEGNTVAANDLIGIHYEISHGATIRDNTVSGNLYGVHIVDSDDAEVYGNRIETSTAVPGSGGVMLSQDDREASGGYVVRNARVHDNLFIMHFGGFAGADQTVNRNDIYLSRNNGFQSNVYLVNDLNVPRWYWLNAGRAWNDWQGFGQDTKGAVYLLDADDFAAPEAAISAPEGGAVVHGVSQVSVQASDDVGVAKVDFLRDGEFQGSDASFPYVFAWDTRSVPNGGHLLSARVHDTSGRSADSAAVSVVVGNAPDILDKIGVSPNPFRPGSHGAVTFSNLPENSRFRIYSLSGQLVWEDSVDASGRLVWRGKDRKGEPAGSGVYWVVVEKGGEKKKLKLAIQR